MKDITFDELLKMLESGAPLPPMATGWNCWGHSVCDIKLFIHDEFVGEFKMHSVNWKDFAEDVEKAAKKAMELADKFAKDMSAMAWPSPMWSKPVASPPEYIFRDPLYPAAEMLVDTARRVQSEEKIVTVVTNYRDPMQIEYIAVAIKFAKLPPATVLRAIVDGWTYDRCVQEVHS